MLKGPNSHTIKQIQDALRDGLQVVNNAVLAHTFKNTVKGKQQLGIEAFVEALLEIPLVISANAGRDAIDTLVANAK